ncbi:MULTISPECIES: histidine kinase [Actinomyces]|uniref:Signal transduction histidine kinase subgroup 3 dimerisation and phosphoacceptor domain-containing protein n=1 Tax=Actinomyces respiraculi TaxID=2744574 RepID=A0A7T0LLM5_9ACTO|nr:MULTISPECIES: histidine kinase [Actinomyces]QPL05418.1 hypothetical protein ID810_12130 [Actinomyces respiraculi]
MATAVLATAWVRVLTDLDHQVTNRSARAVVLAQNRERARITRDLHDSIGQELSALRLTVADNGRGFNTSRLRPAHGLAMLRRAIERQGGDLRIGSSGCGTTIDVTLSDLTVRPDVVGDIQDPQEVTA